MKNPAREMSNDKGSWTITGADGTVQNNGDMIIFAGDVKTQPAAENRTGRAGATPQREENIATSPGEVELRFENGQTHAGALEADLDNEAFLSLDKEGRVFDAPA